jgi:hypothetical protein
MKILEILKKIDEQKQFFAAKGMINEMAEAEAFQTKLSQFVNSEVLSKRDANEQWEIAGNDIASYIEKIIKLLSVIATKSREELEEVYDTKKLKTIYYLIHNSNLELNGIAKGMQKAKVGYIPRYHKTQKIKGTNEFKRLKDEEVNTDLYHLLMNYLLYERGDLVEPLYKFFNGDDQHPDGYQLDPSIIERDFEVYNNIYKDLFGPINNIIPEDLFKAIANMRGTASVTRGNFEFLFTLLFKGGCFEKMPSEKELLKLQQSGEEYSKGDIKIGKNAVEVKVDTGSGGGRIGGQSGFNGAEGIMSEYQSAIKEVLAFVKNTFGPQIPKDAVELQDKFALLMEKYSKDNIQVNIVPREGKWPSYDSVLLEIASIVQEIVGNLSIVGTGDKLREVIINAYIRGWQSLILKEKFQTPVKNIITMLTNQRSMGDMLQSGSIIDQTNFPIMGQAIAFLELAFYALEERFNYIFVIKCNESFDNPKMMIMSNNFIQKIAKEISNGNIQAIQQVLDKGLLFDLPATYKTASRAVRPAITLA